MFYEVLNAVSDMFKKNVYLINGEIMFHSAFKKDIEKVVLFCY